MGAGVRNFDNHRSAAIPSDAAIFASQSMEIRHDRIIREDAAGTLWPAVSSFEGFYPVVPVAWLEGRTLRAIVKACRNDPRTLPDPGIDDISARLTYTPRVVSLPESY